MMKSILYLLNVSWDWIFQRPQIIALLLERDYCCEVVNKLWIGEKKTVKKNPKPSHFRQAIQLRGMKYSAIRSLNQLLFRITLGRLNKYDFIWVGHPSLYLRAFESYRGKIIYDCMDDHASMVQDKGRLKHLEEKLIDRADAVIVSSQLLKDHIRSDKKCFLVRNGYKKEVILPPKEAEIKNRYRIGYIGTVSSWFDADLINEIATVYENVEIHIAGPIERGAKKLNDNIVYDGIIEHSDLINYVKPFDALIMPFLLNDTVLAVDPVKLYEYLSFGKCIISIEYPEIQRFDPYVFFYNNSTDFKSLLDDLCKRGFPAKYDSTSQCSFLQENSWETRLNQICEIIESI